MVFHFTIHGMTREQAEHLLDVIQHIVCMLGLFINGGYHYEQEEKDVGRVSDPG